MSAGASGEQDRAGWGGGRRVGTGGWLTQDSLMLLKGYRSQVWRERRG